MDSRVQEAETALGVYKGERSIGREPQNTVYCQVVYVTSTIYLRGDVDNAVDGYSMVRPW